MTTWLRHHSGKSVRWLLTLTARSWREGSPAPRPASGSLGIPLYGSPHMRRVQRVLVLLHALYGLELLMLGHWIIGGIVALLFATLLLHTRSRHALSAAAAPRRLLLAADGRLHLLTVGGSIEAVNVHPASLRLGSWLMLRLTNGSANYRLLLGPDNVDAAMLATLRRRMVLVDQATDAVLPGAGDRSLVPDVAPHDRVPNPRDRLR